MLSVFIFMLSVVIKTIMLSVVVMNAVMPSVEVLTVRLK
jgi:hypothetical protein